MKLLASRTWRGGAQGEGPRKAGDCQDPLVRAQPTGGNDLRGESLRTAGGGGAKEHVRVMTLLTC